VDSGPICRGATIATQLIPSETKPSLQVNPQTPVAQFADPFIGTGQELPQEAQLAGSFLTSVSQPVDVIPSQSPKPASQVIPHFESQVPFIGAQQSPFTQDDFGA
jgi:hypothetical protein